MATTILNHAAENDQTGWKTEDYHGKQMHVCAAPRASKNEGCRTVFLAFPPGPVNQYSRWAGVPMPHYASDPSFGSAI